MIGLSDVYERVMKSSEIQYNHKGEIVSRDCPENVLFNNSEELLTKLRRKLHCDFECIYHDHASLDTIYKCNECGTVIFTGDDERYDPNLMCPNCSDYKHNDEYWTAEMIEADPSKRYALNVYLNLTKAQKKADELFIKRGNLYDWEFCHPKIISIKNGYIKLVFNCDSHKKSWIKGLRVDIQKWETSDDGIGNILKSSITIPLSITYLIFKIQFRRLSKDGKIRTDNN